MVEPSNKSIIKVSMLKELPLFLGNDANSVDDVRKILPQHKPSTSILDSTTLKKHC